MSLELDSGRVMYEVINPELWICTVSGMSNFNHWCKHYTGVFGSQEGLLYLRWGGDEVLEEGEELEDKCGNKLPITMSHCYEKI